MKWKLLSDDSRMLFAIWLSWRNYFVLKNINSIDAITSEFEIKEVYSIGFLKRLLLGFLFKREPFRLYRLIGASQTTDANINLVSTLGELGFLQTIELKSASVNVVQGHFVGYSEGIKHEILFRNPLRKFLEGKFFMDRFTGEDGVVLVESHSGIERRYVDTNVDISSRLTIPFQKLIAFEHRTDLYYNLEVKAGILFVSFYGCGQVWSSRSGAKKNSTQEVFSRMFKVMKKSMNVMKK